MSIFILADLLAFLWAHLEGESDRATFHWRMAKGSRGRGNKTVLFRGMWFDAKTGDRVFL